MFFYWKKQIVQNIIILFKENNYASIFDFLKNELIISCKIR